MKHLLLILMLCLPCAVFAQGEDDPAAYDYYVIFSPEGWATFNSPSAVTVPDGVDVYIAKIIKNTSKTEQNNADFFVILSLIECPETTISIEDEDGQPMQVEVRYIPQRGIGENDEDCINPVILKYALNARVGLNRLEDDEDYVKNLYEGIDQANGQLIGTDDESEDSYYADGTGDYRTYTLGYTKNRGTAFYEVRPGQELPPNRAFVEISSEMDHEDSPTFQIIIDDDPTRVQSSTVTQAEADGLIRDLFGNAVSNPQRGQVYIRNHHKFIQK